ncbi:uncharacterized protein LOC127811658 [Diospyros lotus]|uniref:uncharacterized protein LOC127811658 n=1 Tax=Diospyros lotus TaxID=55363 RepID=UPI002258B7EC|nr:uncharacterized protein LOC127811658 [Diospyros lotus]
MGQIVKRKKKGRPSKADLARRASEGEPPGAAASEKDVRRSLRRRNVRYIFDFDDFDDLDEEEEEEVEDERRRQKKLKLLLKLQGKEGGAESEPSRTRRVDHAPPASPSSSDSGEKPPKKRKIDGGDAIDADADENDVKNGEIRGTKSGSKGADSVPGTPSEPPLGLPLHDKKTLELILDKLQKKDTYGVYAEPVDPEELPDYHDVIEHPMDFATVRKKLGNGSYSTLEQFESDVILICTNAMQYNAPDTIYHKQARSIQELAKKKFQRLRVDTEPYEKELKTDQKIRSSSYGKKQIKKPMNRVTQEPVGSDFSSGAALATAAEFQSASNATHIGGLERLTNVDGPIEGNTSQIDNNLDKPEDLQGRGLLSRFGRKPFLHDENRRATYNNSDQPVVGSESIFTTFEGEIKQLVTVGLHSDHSYARSLARFAATLGPVAWKVASRRIEQALPPGFKFGRGWVGDYEPLPTPILVLENCSQKEPAFLTKSSHTSDVRKDDKSTKAPGPVQEHNSFPALEGNSSLFDAAVTKSTVTATASNPVPAKEQSVRRTILEGKQPFFGSGGSKPTMAGSPNYQQQSPRSRNNGPERKVVKQVELNYLPTSTNQNMNNLVAEKQIPNGLDVPASRSMETVSRNRKIVQSSSFKHPENKGLVAGGLPNGKVTSNNLDRNRMVVSSSDTNQLATPATYFPHGQEQGLSDPVHLMRMMAENAQKQQKSSNNSPVGSPSVIPTSGPSSRRDDSNNAAAAAARAWMSIGAGGSKVTSENMSTHANQISADSLYNPARDLQPQVSRFRGDFPPAGMHFQPAKNSFPLQPFGAPPVRMEFQNRPVLFPQIVTADLSRFQVQPPWQGPSSKRQPKEKQESHPPDLNIGFQSSGSPVRQSSGVLVDSQQPDLALQL